MYCLNLVQPAELPQQLSTVRLEKLLPFCYSCTFLKRCDLLRSVPFYYRSPFHFFCCLRLNGTVLPPFLGTCNTYMYVRTTSIDVTPTKLTLAVGSLVLQCLRHTAITQITTTALRYGVQRLHKLLPPPYGTVYSGYTNYYHRLTVYSGYTNYYHRLTAYSDYTDYYNCQGLKPGDISRKLKQEGIKATGRGIAKFLANFIESGSVARKPGIGRPSKAAAAVRTWATRGNVMTQQKYDAEPTVQRNGTERTVERNGTDRFTPFLGKRCRCATQTKRTVFRTFFFNAYLMSLVQIPT